MAKKWIEENEELVKLLSYTLKVTSPLDYARRLVAGEMIRMKEELKQLFRAWLGGALNKVMTEKWGIVNKDVRDYETNYAAPWGKVDRWRCGEEGIGGGG